MSSIFLNTLGSSAKPRKLYSNYVPGSYVVTIPDDVWFVIATIQAGGGSAGHGFSNYFPAQGGASGYCLINLVIPVTPGELVPVVIGAGGVGRNTSGMNGAPGGNSSVKSYVARGGQAGACVTGTTSSQNGETSREEFSNITGTWMQEQLKSNALFIPQENIIPSITAKWHSSHSVGVVGVDNIVSQFSFSRGADYSADGDLFTGGAPSFFASGASAGLSTPATPLKGAGGAPASNGGLSGAGGPGFVELVYFSDFTLA